MNASEQEFEKFVKIIDMYIGVTKNYISLTTGLLAFMVAFDKFAPSKAPDTYLNIAILFALTSILCGLYYQYLAVKLTQLTFRIGTIGLSLAPNILIQRPGLVFGVCQVSFFLCALFLGLTLLRAI